MRESEVQAFVVETLAAMGMAAVEAKNLRPHLFDSATGFRFQLSFINAAGPEIGGMAAGIVRNGALHLCWSLRGPSAGAANQ